MQPFSAENAAEESIRKSLSTLQPYISDSEKSISEISAKIAQILKFTRTGISGSGTENNVSMFTGEKSVGDAPGFTYSEEEGSFYNFEASVNVEQLLLAQDASISGGLSAGSIVCIGDLTAGTISASNLSGTNTGDQTITLSGDLSGSGTGLIAATIAAGAVSLPKMAPLAANRIIGNNTGLAATPIALTASQVRTFLGLSISDTPTFSGVTIDTVGFFYASSIGKTQILINSSGSNYGTIQNDAADEWSLGHKTTNSNTLGTSILKWSPSSVSINVPLFAAYSGVVPLIRTGTDRITGSATAKGVLRIGSTTGETAPAGFNFAEQIQIDSTTIQAMAGNSASTLKLNIFGGTVEFGGALKLSSLNTVNASVVNTVTNKVKINVGGTDYYFLVSTSNA